MITQNQDSGIASSGSKSQSNRRYSYFVLTVFWSQLRALSEKCYTTRQTFGLFQYSYSFYIL